MTPTAWALAAAFAVVAGTDWSAVVTGRRSWRPVTKPLALVALIGVAVALEPVDPTIRAWMVVGLVLSLAGDVFLLGTQRWFVPGLVSFLAAHVAYVVALLLAPTSPGWMLAGLALVAAAAVAAAPRLARLGRGEHASLLGPVVAYVVVISAMVVTAFGTADPWAVAGAVLFYVSDATLAWNRFLKEHRWGPTVVMVTYHLGQAGLVGWLVQG